MKYWSTDHMQPERTNRNQHCRVIGLTLACTLLLGGAWLLLHRSSANKTPAGRSIANENYPVLAAKPHEASAQGSRQPAIIGQAGRVQPVLEPEEVESTPVAPEVTQAFPSITEAVADWREFRPDNLTVEPWPGARITFTRTAVKEEGRYVTWIGRNPNLPGASLVGVATASGYDAILVVPGANQISYHVRGDKVVTTESTSGAEGCGNAPVQAPKTAAEPSAFIYDVTYAKGHEPVSEAIATSAVTALLNVDVLVAYDAGTLAAATTKSTDPAGYIDGQCKALLETSNLALSQSLVTAFVWRYLGAIPAPFYTRAGKLADDLHAMAPGGAIADWIKSTRYKNGVDQMVLMVGGDNDWGGIAYGPKQKVVTRDFANAVVKWGLDYSVIAHELAHNFGCQHDREHFEVISLGVYGPPAPDNDGFWCYGQMWSNPAIPGGASSGTSGDIMSYADYSIPYFSNPNISVHVTGFLVGWSWNPDLGTHQIGRAETDPKAAYNAKVLSDNGKAMSELSEEITSLAISQQPQNISVNRGQGMQLRVIATGGGLSYQWMKGGAAIRGATASIYSKTAEDSDAGGYTVVVSNLTGALTSDAATVTVTLPPPPTPVATGGGGGGAALSLWLYGSLGTLWLVRRYLAKG